MNTGIDNEQALIRRLERLERQNRRMKLGALSVLILIGTGMLMGDAVPFDTRQDIQPTILEANGLMIRDGKGKIRIALAAVAGGAGIQIFDEAGKIRIALGVTGQGPDLALLDKSPQTRLSLTVKNDGPHIMLKDANGTAQWRAP